MAEDNARLPVQLILDRLNTSDTLTQTLHDKIASRVEHVEQMQNEIRSRIESLEKFNRFRQGQLDVKAGAARVGFRLSVVILAAFAAGFAGSVFEDRVAAHPPSTRADVTIEIPVTNKKDKDHE